MRRSQSIIIAVLLVLLATSCSIAGTSGREPSPPNPFPIELFAQYGVYSVDVAGQQALTKMKLRVNRNVDLYRNVVVQYAVSVRKGDRYEEYLEKTLLDEEIGRYEKKEVVEDIPLSKHGEYRVEVTANYYSWGQRKTYTVLFDELGVSIDRQN